VKLRRTLIGGSKKMIVYDDLEPSEKIKVYDKGITLNGNGDTPAMAVNGQKYQMLVGYRTGDVWSPQIEVTEALLTELREFTAAIEQGRAPSADGHAGLRVVQIVEAATESMKANGRPIELSLSRCTV